MRPSDVVLLDPCPLTATFKRVENEAAAAFMLLAMRQDEDTFRVVTPVEVGEAIKAHHDKKGFTWIANPFYRPDVIGLVKMGAVDLISPEDGYGSPVQFSEKGLGLLRRSGWVVRVRCPKCEAEILGEDQIPFVVGEAMKYHCVGCDLSFEPGVQR